MCSRESDWGGVCVRQEGGGPLQAGDNKAERWEGAARRVPVGLGTWKSQDKGQKATHSACLRGSKKVSVAGAK